MVMKKSLTMYDRDEKGILIPQEAALEVDEKDLKNYPELKDQTVKVIPMTRGEIKKLFGLRGTKDDDVPDTTKDEDGELIKKYCKEPTYVDEEIPFIKPVTCRSIVNTIFRESGIIIDKEGKKSIKDTDEFGKNCPDSGETKKKEN